MVSPREVRALIEERPDLEPILEAVLTADTPWTFDDVDADSGRFGEFVSTELVEPAGDGYRLVAPGAVQTALAGETNPATTTSTGDKRLRSFVAALGQPDVARRAGGLGAVLTLVVVARLIPYPTVFRDGDVVLSGNDPYYYRVLVEQVVTTSEATITVLPAPAVNGEPLLVVVLAVAATVAGGTPAAAGKVLAWYPVVAAVLTAGLVYLLTARVTGDRRVALAAVAMLAVLPGHAMRTSLGFADHHAFDYPWLVLALWGLVHAVQLPTVIEDVNPAAVAVAVFALAGGVAGSVLAWEAGPLLIIPIGIVVVTEILRANVRSESPLIAGTTIIGGVALAAGTTWLAHITLGWHTAFVAGAPGLLAAGSTGVVLIGVFWARTDLPAVWLAGVEAFILGGGLIAFSQGWPDQWTRLTTSVTTRLLAPRPIAEVQSLFGQSLGWLLLFGFLLFLALPYLAWATHRARTDATWLPVVIYGWYFLTLAMVQVRFVGELSPVLAVFTGLGFVHIAAWVGTARFPRPFAEDRSARQTAQAPIGLGRPSREQVAITIALFLMISSLSIIQVPAKTSQITTSPERHEAALAMAAYANGHDRSYPQTYVLSRWGTNRHYNYVVNSQAQSYAYARANYGRFVTATNPKPWYDRIQGRVGFVITTSSAVTDTTAMGTRLHEAHGSRTDGAKGLAHYRLISTGDAGSIKAFAVVPGARLTGSANPGSTVTVNTTVTVEETTFNYRRQTTTGPNGSFVVSVAYPGQYQVGTQSVTVPAAAVQNNSTIALSKPEA